MIVHQYYRPNSPAVVADPVYVYDHRGLRVRKDSLSSTEVADQEAVPTITLDLQEEGV